MLISATFASVTTASKKAISEVILKQLNAKLQWVLCIYYPVQFNQQFVKVFFDFGSKINTMQPSFVKKTWSPRLINKY